MGFRVALGEICSFNRGTSIPRARMRNSGDLLYIHYGDLYKGFDLRIDVEKPAKPLPFISADEKIKDSQRLNNQDIVYVLTSETVDDLGHAYLFNNPSGKSAVSGTETTIVRVERKDIVLPAYLNYLMSSPRFIGELRQYTRGMKVFRVHPSDVARIEVDLPSIDEQQKVVAILDALYEKQQINTQLNGYLEELARAMYVGVMQEHANIAPLCDIAELNSETYSSKENWSAVCYIDTSALMLNNLAELQHFNLAEEKLPTRARRKVANGDILYSTVRPNQNHYGLLYNPMPHTLASTAFAVIRPRDITMSPLVYLALTDAGITEALQQLAETSTSTIPSIRPVDLEQIAVLVPSDEYGNEIAAQIEAAFKQIDCNKRENRELAILRDALLPKLMSGEIDVSKIDLAKLNSHLA